MADGCVAGRVASLLSLLSSQEAGLPARSSRVWLGKGLGAVSKKVYDRVLRWEYVYRLAGFQTQEQEQKKM